jgi:hypothetical protein
MRASLAGKYQKEYDQGMKKRPFEATKITVFIPTAQKEALDRLSDETGAPYTVHIRRALEAYLGVSPTKPKSKQKKG